MSSQPNQRRTADLPAAASVVVVGAGLSGLVAARELVAAGIDDVVVLDARDRVGGRLHQLTRANGQVLMKGGEFTGPCQVELQKLAGELGIEVEPMPAFAQPELGAFVRIFDGQRHVEALPLASDPAAGEAYGAAMGQLDALAATIPADAPWDAPNAAELDRRTFGDWLDEHVHNPAARNSISAELPSFGDPYEISLLYLTWFLSCFGGLEALAMSTSQRLVGGTAQVPIRLAADLGDRVVLDTPVRLIDQSGDRAVVHFDGGSIDAGAVIVAMEPGQAAKIDFEPPLPAARDRLQARWLGGHGAKVFAVYDRPFWREDGLCGIAFGPAPIQLALDLSPTDGSEGILCGIQFTNGPAVATHSDAIIDPEQMRVLAIEALTTYFGPEAANPNEVHVCSWEGDHWSQGCGSGLPLGVLSTAGRALWEPSGQIVWAGAESGTMDFMEGAVTAGQRAAREAASLAR